MACISWFLLAPDPPAAGEGREGAAQQQFQFGPGNFGSAEYVGCRRQIQKRHGLRAVQSRMFAEGRFGQLFLKFQKFEEEFRCRIGIVLFTFRPQH